MIQVNLAHHLWLKQGTPDERWYNAGLQNVTEAEAETLRGLDGVTFLGVQPVDGGAVPNPTIPVFDFPKVASGAEALAMHDELAAHIAEHYPDAPAPPTKPVSAQVFTNRNPMQTPIVVPGVTITPTPEPPKETTE